MEKFKPGDPVRYTIGTDTGTGVVIESAIDDRNPWYLVRPDLDMNAYIYHESLLSEVHKTLKDAFDIKKGAKYDLAGATLYGDSDGDLGVGPDYTEEYGKYLSKSTLGYLLEAGAKITILSEPEEAPEPPYVDPDFKPGDWVSVIDNSSEAPIYCYLPHKNTKGVDFVSMKDATIYSREELPERLKVIHSYQGEENA